MANHRRPVEFPTLADRLETVPCISMTLAEAAPACGVSTSLLKQAIEAGTLRSKRTSANGTYLVTPAALRAWFESLPDA
ncbi:hypothetical protein NSI01_54040 [Pimelobacter simplex]|nr:hypothetical protein NSI01_54040 [Pimelobacter simplex]